MRNLKDMAIFTSGAELAGHPTAYAGKDPQTLLRKRLDKKAGRAQS